MASVELTQENFDAYVKDPKYKLVLIDFWSETCPPCKMFAPIYESMSDQYPDVLFGKINTLEQPTISQHFQIRAVPTIMAFRDNINLLSQPGAMPENVFAQFIDKLLDVDMQAIKKELNEQAAQTQS